MTGWRRRGCGARPGIAVGLAVLAVLVVAPARPAAADAPRPTDYRSTVVSVDPSLPDGVTVDVVGGDSFLQLSVDRGHTAVVPDYAGSGDTDPAPYLRFRADGTVQRNRLAVATAANESRFGTAATTPDPDAEPRWETVASNGTYAWHDHRIHWMSPNAPRAVAEGGRMDMGGPDGTWQVPLVVDGTATVVTGTLVLSDAPSPIPWLLLAGAVAAGATAAGRRWGLRWIGVPGAAASAAAMSVAWSTWAAAPAGTGASALPLVIPFVGLLSSVALFWGPERLRLLAASATAAALIGWAVVRWSVLTSAVLPTDLDYGVDRAVTAVALGVGLSLAVLLLWAPRVRASPTA